MNIYIAKSSFDNETSLPAYNKTFSFLQSANHRIFTLSKKDYSIMNKKSTFKKWSSLLAKSDLAVFEASFPSDINLGFEIGMVLSKNKVVVLLHKSNKNPSFLDCFHSPRLVKSSYSDDSFVDCLEWSLDEASLLINRRFSFFINPEIDRFLDTMASENNTSKSEYLREIIEQKMKREK